VLLILGQQLIGVTEFLVTTADTFLPMLEAIGGD
jgi:hypothetical protein